MGKFIGGAAPLKKEEVLEQNRIYDGATEGIAEPDTAPTSGGRGIDQLKADLLGGPIDDTESGTEFPEAESES